MYKNIRPAFHAWHSTQAFITAVLPRFIMGTALLVITFQGFSSSGSTKGGPTTASLSDWSDWRRYRETVNHPTLGTKLADVDRARKNMARHGWAKKYASSVEKEVSKYLDQLTPEFLTRMVPDTTPLSTLFTPCPACRDQGKPYQPHGTWKWRPQKSEQLQCTVCRTVFPDKNYPEEIELKTSWGRPQVFSYYGGETFPIFQWEHGRPSFSGNIRAQKIEFISALARKFAIAYALTGNIRYAGACQKILIRLSEVYPHYLVHCAYGEVADMDPREASFSMLRLNAPELTYPPNKPNRRLFKDFWTAGRATGKGMEGTQLRQWTEAYDLTCDARTADGRDLYKKEEKLQIERDLLLEGTVLAVADQKLNNKSIGNRSGVGLVGACLGHPDMVRFGLSGFREMVDEWFLPDGGTPESISYGFMGVGGVRDLSLAFRDYSDPPGYFDEKGERYDELNLFTDSKYPLIWEAFLDCMLPDLTFPAFADSHVNQKFKPTEAEIIASVYPENERYMALLKELSGKDATPADPATAIFLRSPDFQGTDAASLTFPDHCRPHYKIGYIRSGEDGGESLLSVSATPWGIHRHQDSLNLYYWKNGHELLTDLGYLWDHADEHMTFRTFAHNLVIIDGEEQETGNRGGELECFYNNDRVKVMQASSGAYPQATTYRRTSALIDHGDGDSYAVDLFEVEGGSTQDYVFHGPKEFTGIDGIQMLPFSGTVYDLTDVQKGSTTSTWSIMWNMADDMAFKVWNMPQHDEQAMVGSGWGQRDPRNSDRGTTIPYIVRRTRTENLSQFASVLEGSHPNEHFVLGVERLETANNSVAFAIETNAGTDYVVWHSDGSVTLPGNHLVPQSTVAVFSTDKGDLVWSESVPK